MTDENRFDNSEFAQTILSRTDDLAAKGLCGLIERYSAMARDATREREAEEWSEGLIGDTSTET